MNLRFVTFLILTLTISHSSYGDDIKTNHVHMANAPKWLKESRIDRVVDHIQSKMEWDIRRVEVKWYGDAASFAAANQLGPSAIAITTSPDIVVHLSPRVTDTNFDKVFGHEMVHVISLQKYKGAIPRWLEEGLANYLAKDGSVDYRWLAQQPLPKDVKELVHPFSGDDNHVRYVYMASQALAELIGSKCDMEGLLRLSVKRNLEDYLAKICNIDDINVAFKKWVTAHGQSKN